MQGPKQAYQYWFPLGNLVCGPFQNHGRLMEVPPKKFMPWFEILRLFLNFFSPLWYSKIVCSIFFKVKFSLQTVQYFRNQFTSSVESAHSSEQIGFSLFFKGNSLQTIQFDSTLTVQFSSHTIRFSSAYIIYRYVLKHSSRRNI
jgi:hypothetical protein